MMIHTHRGVTDRSYNWVDKDPVVDQLRTWVQESRYTYRYIAEHTGVSESTVRNLFSGQTRRPQQRTVSLIGRLFNKTLGWVDL